MATIDALTSTGSNSIRGYGGLASGLDRDTLIEQLTAGTQAKIDAANQQKTKLEWEQEAIRTITDMMYDFTNKYTSYSSSTNLLSSSFYGRTDITVNGENGKYLTVSGSTQTSELMKVLGVKQLAQKATLNMTTNASDRTLSLGAISTTLSTPTQVNVVGGEKLYVKVGSTRYTVTLGRGDGYSYNTAANTADAINESLKQVSLSNGRTLADVLQVSESGGKLVFQNTDSAGNTVTITGGTGEALDALGLTNKPDDGFVINHNNSLTATGNVNAIQQKSIASQLAGKSLSFQYNGTTKWIKLPAESELNTLDDLKTHLQKELNSAFGNGRITVDITSSGSNTGSLTFKTTLPDGSDDDTSTLSITASTGNLTGEDSLFGIQDGESNRLNLNAKLSEAGLANSTANLTTPQLVINGKTIQGITADSTIQEIMDAVNSDPDAGVTITYQQNTDRFIITSTQDGASGQVSVSGNVADALFGSNGTDYSVTAGQDAIIAVQYAGSNQVTEITRGSNTISIDGLNITANGTFGYNSTGQLDQTAEAVTFTAKVNTDTIVDAVKTMVEEFNEIVEHINTQVSTKPDRDYQPLTSSQKAEMSEDQIKLWEDKAKKGLLFMDSDIRGLADSLRFVIPENFRTALEGIGITVSSDYSDNGKLTLDESKLRAALESDPESVRNALASSVQTNADGTTTQGGLLTNIKTIMDRYASTTGATKGILIERAGSSHSVTSMLDNALLDQINEVDDRIASLTERLSTEQDRYISQFTQLELLVSQMNSQSSYLSSLMA